MEIKKCGIDDAKKLAALNRELIEDEKSGNAMTLPELCERMKSFLAGNYDAYFFFEGGDWSKENDGFSVAKGDAQITHRERGIHFFSSRYFSFRTSTSLSERVLINSVAFST